MHVGDLAVTLDLELALIYTYKRYDVWYSSLCMMFEFLITYHHQSTYMQPFKAMEWLTVAPHPRPMTITKVERSIMMYDIPPYDYDVWISRGNGLIKTVASHTQANDNYHTTKHAAPY